MTTAGCIDPGTVTPEQLLAYVDGEAPPQVARHVAACATCAAEAAELTKLQLALGDVLFRFDCPPSQILGEYALDLVTPEDRTAIAQHTLDCARCTLDLRGLREFLAGDDLLTPVRPSVLGNLRRIVATLFAPDQSMVPAVALRGSPGAGAQPQTYRAGPLTLTLGPGPVGRRGSASLMGLLVREDGELDVPAGSNARLLSPSGAADVAEIDELGNFAFDDLAPATYLLELQLGDDVVVVERVPVAG